MIIDHWSFFLAEIMNGQPHVYLYAVKKEV